MKSSQKCVGCKCFNVAGTTSNATDSSSAAAKSEADGDSKTTDDDDKGEQLVIDMP